jgi:hypothetical protein
MKTMKMSVSKTDLYGTQDNTAKGDERGSHERIFDILFQ